MSEVEFITIVVPVLNEAAYIEKAIRSLVPSSVDHEIIVVDGGSSDGTQEIVRRLSGEMPGIRLVDNPARIQAAAVNLGARAADPRSKVFVQADAHCSYPEGFAAAVARALAETGAQSVVVPMRTVGRDTCFQAAAAAAQNSRLGNGGSAHRGKAVSGWVDHGHHAGFDREAFMALGGYDESFGTNHDAEYDVRLNASGGRVWMLAEAEIVYHPRKTPLSLARQYFRHGYGRASTVIKHGVVPKGRQMAPVAAFLGCAGGIVLTAIHPGFLAIPASYGAACLAAGAVVGRGKGPCGPAAGLAAMTMHLSWGAGFLARVSEWGAGRVMQRGRRVQEA
jgi:succinoglycan biosynthesis protein ExoA